MNRAQPKADERIIDVKCTLTVSEAGAKGGNTTRERYGIEHFRRIGQLGGRRTANLYADLLKKLGKRGGRPRRPILGNCVGEEANNKGR